MKEQESALFSEYIIDGIRCESTPADMLKECMEYSPEFQSFEEKPKDIIDETIEPPLASFEFDDSLKEVYLSLTSKAAPETRAFRMLYPDHFTRLRAAAALIDRIWNVGHFRLGDLSVCAAWEWNTSPVGSMAAFYSSTNALSSYLYDLGIRIQGVEFHENDNQSQFTIEAWLRGDVSDDSNEDDGMTSLTMFKASPYESMHPWIEESRKCPECADGNPDSWFIYIPFDTCSFKSGGSLLSELMSQNGNQAPTIQDPDYFIDCYEVVRELIEDGIIISGSTVADGGLITALNRMCSSCGADIDIEKLMSSYQTASQTNVLFGEVPGVVVQIHGNDYDYVDSQLTLQDVAYYPLGQPTLDHTGIRISSTGNNGVAGILAALLEQASEGED